MSALFSKYAFHASGVPSVCPGPNACERTLPDRLAEIKNIKDFGAIGDGVTDDWAAITAAYNWTTNNGRGTIFFPPGTYFVSQPVVIDGENSYFHFLGVLGASTIIGNFADYVLKRGDALASGVPNNTIEDLSVVNKHPSGGGIRMGNCVVGAIRNCTVIANQGISNASDDGAAPNTDLDFNIENCSLSPGSNVSGSNGIMSVADGLIVNCRVVGFETGMRFWANEGNMTVTGCYFEENITGIACSAPSKIGGTGGLIVSGCWFKNNGTAMFGPGIGGGRFCGIRIEASEAVTVGGARPQYGIHVVDAAIGFSLFAGIIVTGQYDQYGVAIDSHAGFPTPSYNTFIGVRSFNTSSHGGQAWGMPSTSYSVRLIECNSPAPVCTMANLPTILAPVTSISWSGGTVTATVAADVSHLSSAGPQPINVQGVTPSGYNGLFTAIISGVNTVTYTVADPGGPGSGGTTLFNPTTNDGTPNTFEGDCYNVSDSNASAWGANPTIGGGTTHAKVRWNGTNWTVIGR